MAVEARHLSLFAPQLLCNREMMNDGNMYSNLMGYGVPPLSGTTTETPFPMYGSAITGSFPGKTAMKAESGLTCNFSVSRKRSRDFTNPFLSFPNRQIENHSSGSFTFLGEDISLQIQQQQQEIDRYISQHTEKVRMEIEDRRKRNSRRIIAAVEDGIMKRLRVKEEEIEKIGKLNWALEERVKSLCMENQIWRELAQTNEATANALRSSLEQVLAHVQDDQRHHGGVDEAAALLDDAQSCCGSNYCGGNEEERRAVAGCGGERKSEKNTSKADGTVNSNRWCRNCGKEESSVLLLPCRHLCLCTVCGSSLLTCPICKSTKTASVHVNMSSC